MKKLVSVILAIVMVIAVAATSLVAFAAVDPVVSPTKKPEPTVVTEVNGKPSKAVTYTKDSDEPYVYTFTYTGNGKLIGWEFRSGNKKLEEGKDYKVIKRDGNSITIELLTEQDEVIANAIVEEAVASPSSDKKSPKTGAALAGVAAMGAGAAILAISKKRKND